MDMRHVNRRKKNLKLNYVQFFNKAQKMYANRPTFIFSFSVIRKPKVDKPMFSKEGFIILAYDLVIQ